MITRSLGCVCLLTVSLAPLTAQQLSPVERAHAVAVLWAEARYNFAGWDRVRANWDSALVANLRLASEPQSDLLFYRRLRRFVAVLDDGAAAVTPPVAVRSRIARPPLRLESIERRPFILDYAENDEMRVARPERLSEILAVQGIPAEAWIRDSVLPETAGATTLARWQRAVAGMLEGEKGTTLSLRLRNPRGDERGISVTRSVSLSDRWPLAPTPFVVESLAGDVITVRLGSFADEDLGRRFDHALPDFAGVRALVLDLRHAAGGRSAVAYQLLARLTDRPFATVRWRTPQHRAVFRARGKPDSATTWYAPPPDTIAARSDGPAYGGPLAVLASHETAGAPEDFLAAFRATARGVIIGEPSAGAAGDPAVFALPRGWTVALSVTRHETPDGGAISGVGVAPDVEVAPRVSDALAARDLAWMKARQLLSGASP